MDKYHILARKKMEKKYGRKLSIFECVHHIDLNPSNNKLSNLVILTREAHASLHRSARKNKKVPSEVELKSAINETYKAYKANLINPKVSHISTGKKMEVHKYIVI